MKKFLSLLLFSSLILACQKEEAPDLSVAEKTVLNVSYGADTVQKIDVYLPANRTSATTKAVVLIHGGAWISGNKVDMNQFIPVLKKNLPDYAIFNIGYRLGVLPATNPFPTQETDVKAAVDFVVGKAGEYGFNRDKLVLLGGSAGGHLALLQGYKQTSPKAKAVVSLFGPTDLPALYNGYPAGSVSQLALQLLLGGSPTSNASLYQSSSPVNFVSAGAPPTLLLHGTADGVVPLTQSTALKNRLEAAGVSVTLVTYANAGHGDWDNATYEKAYAEITSFLKAKNP